MNNTVILFCCHFWSPELEREYSRLVKCCGKDFDVVLSYDCSGNNALMSSDFPSHLFTIEQIRKMGYGFPEHEGLWSHIEYPIIDYYLRNPRYDYYWRIEYDVRFGGDWGVFFRAFQDNEADLLGTYVRAYKDDPDWYWWNSINFNVDQDCLRGVFFPVIRFSKRSLACLDQKYRAGAVGYSEVIVPTLLGLECMTIEDIGKRFYDFFTFSYIGIVIRKRGKLHHPVRKMKFRKRLKGTLRGLWHRGRII